MTFTGIAFGSVVAQGADSVAREVKEGWQLGLFPTLTYSNTLGFQYGACGNVFYYGYGERNSYPDPMHKFSFEASHFTRGRSRFWLALDSKALLPGWRVTLSALDIMDPLYFFYGFNGPAQPYSEDLDEELHYNVDRNIFQAFANFQSQLSERMKVVAGISFSNYRLRDYDGSAYGGNDTATLYRQYVSSGIIGSEEAEGGNVLEVRGGIVYDTRDVESAPNRGLLLEAFLNGGFSPQHTYFKACAYFSHFLRIPIGLKPGDPVFAYRLGYEGTLTGDVPFYMQQSVPMLVPHTMLTEGFGSAKTIRGYYENRIVADGVAWGNFELRVKVVKFTLWNQYFYIAVNPFFDLGLIVQPYRIDRQARAFSPTPGSAEAFVEERLRDEAKRPLASYGMGFKLVWNENFVLSAEVAHCVDRALGSPFWIDLGVNYVF
ncbi:MAG: BamA/TamA family outer membrane protein [Bacteroidales bacterium]|nr:BamA/TamA family outer membrane protein [Bacteroidales bacterium]